MLDGLLIDLIILVILVVATAAGLSRGVLREACSLGIWLLVLAVAIPNFQTLSDGLGWLIPDTSLRGWALALALVLGTALVLSMVDLGLLGLHRRAGRGSHDPLFGLLFGALRGLLVVMVGVILAHRTPLPDRFEWYQSQLVSYAEALAHTLRPHLPRPLAAQIRLRGEGMTDRQIVLPRDSRGHFLTRAWINGMPVQVLVDTGATMVMIPEHMRYDLWLEAGESFPVNTATGEATAQHTVIDALKVGPILLHDVEAALVPSPKETVLLGMSFLRQVRFQQTGSGLLLEQARPGLE